MKRINKKLIDEGWKWINDIWAPILKLSNVNILGGWTRLVNSESCMFYNIHENISGLRKVTIWSGSLEDGSLNINFIITELVPLDTKYIK